MSDVAETPQERPLKMEAASPGAGMREAVPNEVRTAQPSPVLVGLASAAVALLLATLIVAVQTLVAVGRPGLEPSPAKTVPSAAAPASSASPSSPQDTAAMKRELDRLKEKTAELERQAASIPAKSVSAKPAPPDPQLSQIEKSVAQNSAAIARLSKVVGAGAVAATATPVHAVPADAKAMVRVFFGTDRAIRPNAASLSERFTSERGVLSLGSVDVSIPQGHALGKLERKFWPWHSATDASRFFVVQRAESLTKEQFVTRMKEDFARLGTRSALVFIHGFNVSFEDAALRSAQMAFDLDMKSLPAFFSWPSQGSIPKYTVDEQLAEWAEPHLRKFLETFADESRAETLIVLAHSMGSRPTTRALRTLLTARPELQARFKELILAAPDIDADVFKDELMPPLLALQQRVTLYASSGDRALRASKEVHGASRAGDAGAGMVVLTGVETLDATGIDTDFLGHSYYGSTRALLTDINLLVHQNMRAAKRPFLEARSVANVPYWVFKP
jgi:esterase/lipase superfamily enzyme